MALTPALSHMERETLLQVSSVAACWLDRFPLPQAGEG